MEPSKLKPIVEKVFKEYFLAHNFKEDKSRSWSTAYKNEYCSLIFCPEYSELELRILKTGEDYEYDIFTIHNVLKGSHLDTKDIPSGGLEDKYTKMLKAYKDFLETDLPTLPKGDFFWASDVKRLIDFDTMLYTKVLSLPNTHPICIKYLNHDFTWKEDIIKLIEGEKN